MTDVHFIDPSQFLADLLAEASPDLLRSMLSTFMQSLMGADADAACNADYGQRRITFLPAILIMSVLPSPRAIGL